MNLLDRTIHKVTTTLRTRLNTDMKLFIEQYQRNLNTCSPGSISLMIAILPVGPPVTLGPPAHYHIRRRRSTVLIVILPVTLGSPVTLGPPVTIGTPVHDHTRGKKLTSMIARKLPYLKYLTTASTRWKLRTLRTDTLGPMFHLYLSTFSTWDE